MMKYLNKTIALVLLAVTVVVSALMFAGGNVAEAAALIGATPIVFGTALTTDKDMERKEGLLESFPVLGSTTIYKGSLVCIGTTGYAIPATATAGLRFVGIADNKGDNSSGSDGDVEVKVRLTGVVKLVATSITQAMVGRLMYVVDDATIDETGSNFVCVGRLVDYDSATSGWVDIGQRGMEGGSVQGIHLGDIDTGTYGWQVRGAINAGASEGIAGYFEGHLVGAITGHCYALGAWMNIDDGATPAGLCVAIDCGVYENAAADMSSARVIGVQIMAILTNSPSLLHPFRINTTKTVTAVIAAANPGSVNYVANAGTSSGKLGDVPIADIVGVGVVYMRVYDGRG